MLPPPHPVSPPSTSPVPFRSRTSQTQSLSAILGRIRWIPPPSTPSPIIIYGHHPPQPPPCTKSSATPPRQVRRRIWSLKVHGAPLTSAPPPTPSFPASNALLTVSHNPLFLSLFLDILCLAVVEYGGKDKAK